VPPAPAQAPSSGGFPPPGLLTPLLAAATAARGRAAPRAGSTHGRSAPRPWPVCRGATAWPTPCHGWAQAVAEAVGRWHEANRSYHRPETISAAAVGPPRVCTAWRRDAQSTPHAGAG